jgi:hypothetical protein
MPNDLVTASGLAHLPGAPFSETQVDGAVAALRRYLGWHVAPLKAETFTLDTIDAQQVLKLPTRKLVSVVQIRRTYDDAIYPTTAYEISLTRGAVRRKGTFWPVGWGSVEVDVTHGYASCPVELLSPLGQVIVATRRDRSIKTVQIVDSMTTYGLAAAMFESLLDESVLAAYRIDNLPGIA